MTPYVGQKCIVTACGVEGPGEVIEGADSVGDYRVRLDFPHKVYPGGDQGSAGEWWWFRRDGRCFHFDDVTVRFLPDATPGAPYTRTTTETGTIRYVLGDQACVEFNGRLEIVSLGGGE